MLRHCLFYILALCSSLFFTAFIGSVLATDISSEDTFSNREVSVEAELTYTEDRELFLRDLLLQIIRNSQIYQAALPVEQLPHYQDDYDFVTIGAEVRTVDLDSDREPEIIVDVTEAGAYCCSHSFIYTYSPRSEQYKIIAHFWGNYRNSYRGFAGTDEQENDSVFSDLDGDGYYEFIALDNRFDGEFVPYVASLAPVQVWRYQDSGLVDVTRNFPELVYKSAVESWEAYQQIRSQYDADTAKGAMAAYVGAKFLLGQEEDAIGRLQQAYGGSAEGRNLLIT